MNNSLDKLIPQTIYLSEKDMEFFLESLNNPPKPNEKLKALMRGEKIPNHYPPHYYEPETTSGIGFCKICYSDDENDDCHIKRNL